MGVIRIGSELPAFCLFDQLKSAALLNVIDFQLFECARRLRLRALCANSLGRAIAGSLCAS